MPPRPPRQLQQHYLANDAHHNKLIREHVATTQTRNVKRTSRLQNSANASEELNSKSIKNGVSIYFHEYQGMNLEMPMCMKFCMQSFPRYFSSVDLTGWARIHSSHRRLIMKDLVFCGRCGLWSTMRVSRGLQSACKGACPPSLTHHLKKMTNWQSLELC